MTGVAETEIRGALKAVIDPATGRGADSYVVGISFADDRVSVALDVDPADAGRLERLRGEAEAALAGLAGVAGATVVLTAERGLGEARPVGVAAAPRAAAVAPQPQPGPGGGVSPAPGVSHVVAVASGKGGVGKSSVAVNLALALGSGGRRVGLLDADVYGPSVPRMMGVSGKPGAPDGARLSPMEAYGVKCMSMGFLVAEDTATIWRGPMVSSAIEQMLTDVDWGTLDALVVDMPPGTGDIQLTLAQKAPLAGAVIVSTPQDIALLDARRGVAMFRDVAVPILGLVENMSYHLCANCGHREDIFGHGGAEREAARLGIPFLGAIPLDRAMRAAGDAGRPISLTRPDGEIGRAFAAIAGRVWSSLEAGAAARPPPRIMG